LPELVLNGPAQATACSRCGSEVAPGLLSCPACGRLVHAEQLQRLAWEAEAAQQAMDRPRALEHWRAALSLIPVGTRQHETVAARVFELEQGLPKAPAQHHGNAGKQGAAAGLGALGLILLKFKTVIFLVLGKAKFLVFGLSKLTTVASMFLSFGYYWMRFGWAFGAGLVVSIYVHEMGHVWKLRSYGVPATAPMFIPGFGALIRSHRAGTIGQQARIGLWGPLWGLAAPVVAALIYFATGVPTWAVIARWGAMINLFNLLPVWQLDGGHAFEALSKSERWVASGAVLAAYLATGEHTLVLVMLGCGWQLFRAAPQQGDRTALQIYIALAWAFSAFAVMLPAFGAR
jgi:Zn-dependent protease